MLTVSPATGGIASFLAGEVEVVVEVLCGPPLVVAVEAVEFGAVADVLADVLAALMAVNRIQQGRDDRYCSAASYTEKDSRIECVLIVMLYARKARRDNRDIEPGLVLYFATQAAAPDPGLRAHRCWREPPGERIAGEG